MDTPLMPVVEQWPPVRKSLRISIVTETYPPEVNGVATSIARFVAGLRELGHEIQLVRPRQDGSDRPECDERFHEVLRRGVAIPRYPNLRMGLPARRVLVDLWRGHRPDVVHVVTEGPLGWSALQAARSLGVPVSSDFRTNFHAYSRHYGIGWLRKPIAAYLRKFHNLAAVTLVPTEALRAELAAHGFRNVDVVARGVDTNRFDPSRRSEALRHAWGASPRDPVILHVGRLAAEKNLDALVAAFREISARCPSARLVLVGDGPQARSVAAQCPGAVFAGQRTGDDLAAHYASGDVFLFPSVTETFGNVTLEAMASGLAVVAYDYAAAAQVIRHRVTGLLARFDDTRDFVAQAAALACDPARIRDFGAQARVAAQALEWGRVVRRFEAVLLDVANARPTAARRRPQSWMSA